MNCIDQYNKARDNWKQKQIDKTVSNVETIIQNIEQADEVEILEFDFDPCFRLMREMEEAMNTFVDRCEEGSIRSRKTYQQFKAILGR